MNHSLNILTPHPKGESMGLLLALINCQLALMIFCLANIGSELEKIRKSKED
jgi:hypothetical protein